MRITGNEGYKSASEIVAAVSGGRHEGSLGNAADYVIRELYADLLDLSEKVAARTAERDAAEAEVAIRLRSGEPSWADR